MTVSLSFRDCVNQLVAAIPRGRVMTYGQLADLAGQPGGARAVGGLAHFGDPSLPWHRVVNARGRLASGFPGGRIAQYQLLVAEGIVFSQVQIADYRLDLKLYLYQPGLSRVNSKPKNLF